MRWRLAPTARTFNTSVVVVESFVVVTKVTRDGSSRLGGGGALFVGELTQEDS